MGEKNGTRKKAERKKEINKEIREVDWIRYGRIRSHHSSMDERFVHYSAATSAFIISKEELGS